jgi:hypothetical protein
MSHKNQLYGCLIGRSAGDIFITSKIYCGCDSRSGGAVGIATEHEYANGKIHNRMSSLFILFLLL